MIAMKYLVLITILVLGGCATTMKDFRSNKLSYVAQLPGTHQPMAACVMAKVEEETDNARPDVHAVAAS